MAWVPLIILALLAAAMVALPLVAKRTAPKSREEYDLQVYRDQLREMEDDVARGLITPTQEAAARAEIDRRVLGLSKTGYTRKTKLPRWQIALALAIAVPLTSLSMYLWRGDPGATDQPFAARPDLVRADVNDRELLAFIAEREAALATNPNDANGWIMLGRAYIATGRFEESASAMRRAVSLGSTNAGTYMELVEAIINGTGGIISPPALEAINQALAADPAHPAARFYDGIARAQGGKTREAFDVWLKLAADTPADAPYLGLIRRQLEGAARALNIDLATMMPAPAPPTSPLPFGTMTQEEQTAMIGQMVDRLAAQLEQNPNDVQGWMRLATSYRVLERWDDAKAAITKAAVLEPDNVEILAEQAAIFLTATDPALPFPIEVRQILERVLTIDPENLEALYFVGVAAAEAGEKEIAAENWVRLLNKFEPGTQAHTEVRARLDGLTRQPAPAPAPRP